MAPALLGFELAHVFRRHDRLALADRLDVPLVALVGGLARASGTRCKIRVPA